MAAALPEYVGVHQAPIIPAHIRTSKTALYHLFDEVKEEREGSLSVATQRDGQLDFISKNINTDGVGAENAFTDTENLAFDREFSKEHLLENIKTNLQAGASVEEFCGNIWGLDTAKITSILSRDWAVNQAMLSRYNRQLQGSSMRRRPFRAIWSNLQADIFCYFGMSYRDTQDVFWDKDEAYHLENFFALGAPDLLRVWKAAVSIGDEIDVAPDWEDVKAFVVFSQGESTSICLEDGKSRMPSAIKNAVPATGAAAGQCFSSSLKRRRESAYSQSTSTLKRLRTSQVISEDEVRLATYAVECLVDYTRRYTTGILVDGTSISLYYMDRNLSIRTAPFDFSTREGAQYLALVIFALTQCDNICAGFDPHIHLLQLSDDPSLHKLVANDHDVINFDAECFAFPQPLGARPVFYLVGDCIHRYSGLFGHGMSTFTVQEGTLGMPIATPKRILKTIWRRATSPSDAEIVEKLKATVAELAAFLPIMEDIGRWDAKALNFPWVKMSLPPLENGEELALQCSLTNPDMHIWEVDTLDNFKKIFKDCLQVHHLAWSKGSILHGSISEQSLGAYKQPEGSADAYNGIIKHWELGTEYPHRPPVEIGNLKAQSTRPFDASVFMAIDVAEDASYLHHSGSVRTQHFYRHDLESFFYILVWACVHYSLLDKHRDAPHPHEKIRGWLNLGRGAECKRELLQDDNLFMLLVTDLVKDDWQCLVRGWVMPLRNMFADAIQSIPDEESPEYEKYDLETCNGKITFQIFMEAITNPSPVPQPTHRLNHMPIHDESLPHD